MHACLDTNAQQKMCFLKQKKVIFQVNIEHIEDCWLNLDTTVLG